MHDTTDQPLPARRIVGFDIARAFAVFGMVIVNFKIAMGVPETESGWLVAIAKSLEGRAAATFVVLAGVGLTLLSNKGRVELDRARITRDRNTLLRRALFLFVAGALYTPIWTADILHFYGVYIAIAAFLIAAPTKLLWVAAVLLVFGFMGMLVALDYERGWNWETLEYEGLWTLAGAFRHIFFNGFHPVVPWLAFMLVGMSVGRLDLRVPRVRRRVFVLGALAAALAETASWLLIRTLADGASAADREIIVAVFGTDPMPPAMLYMLAGTGTACAVIAICVEVGERWRTATWLRPLIATGQLALTLYVAHVIVGMGALEAMGRLDGQTIEAALVAAFVFCAGSVAFAQLWRRRFQRGPLEALMRFVTQRR